MLNLVLHHPVTALWLAMIVGAVLGWSLHGSSERGEYLADMERLRRDARAEFHRRHPPQEHPS